MIDFEDLDDVEDLTLPEQRVRVLQSSLETTPLPMLERIESSAKGAEDGEVLTIQVTAPDASVITLLSLTFGEIRAELARRRKQQ